MHIFKNIESGLIFAPFFLSHYLHHLNKNGILTSISCCLITLQSYLFNFTYGLTCFTCRSWTFCEVPLGFWMHKIVCIWFVHSFCSLIVFHLGSIKLHAHGQGWYIRFCQWWYTLHEHPCVFSFCVYYVLPQWWSCKAGVLNSVGWIEASGLWTAYKFLPIIILPYLY